MSVLTNFAGINIAEDRIQLVEIVNKDNKLVLENVDEEFFESSLSLELKESKFIHILQNSFNEILLRKPLQTSKISISLPPSFFKIFEIPIDKNLTKSDLEEYIVWEISKLYPTEKKDTYSFNKIILNAHNPLSYRRVLVFSIEKALLKRIHKFCIRNNFQLRLIDNAHTATTGFFYSEHQSNLLSIFIQDFHISTLLSLNNNIVHWEYAHYSNINQIGEIISNIRDDIIDKKIFTGEIEKYYVFGNSVTNELKKNIANLLNVEIMQINPFEQFSISMELEENVLASLQSQRFASAAAISLRI